MPMTSDHNKELVKLFLCEMYGNWRYEIIDDIIHNDYFISRNSVNIISHNNEMPIGSGKKTLRRRVEYLRKAMPDMKYDIINILASGNEVIVWWIWTGTQKDDLFGFPPKEKSVRIFGTNLFRFKDGKIFNTLVTFDSFSMLVQLGHIKLVAEDPNFISQYLTKIEEITQDMG